jgi:hypothetical protein
MINLFNRKKPDQYLNQQSNLTQQRQEYHRLDQVLQSHPHQTINSSQQDKKYWTFILFKKKKERIEYGDMERKIYEEKLKQVEQLLSICRDKAMFTKRDWIEQNIEWDKELRETYVAATAYAKIKIELMNKEIMFNKQEELKNV